MSGTTKYGNSSLYNNTGVNNSAFGNAAAYKNLDASCMDVYLVLTQKKPQNY
jgi:hypothetical protein